MHPELPPLPISDRSSTLFAQWNRFRSNKTAYFALAGFLGGFGGDLATELFPINSGGPKSIWESIICTALWVAAIAGGIVYRLATAEMEYSRRQTSKADAARSAVKGLLQGAIAGAAIEAIYTAGFMLGLKSGSLLAFLYQCLVWGMMGGVVGGLLAKSVPNFQRWRAVCAGGVGGSIGCAGFLVLCSILPEVLGRLFGVGVMGLAIGLSIVVAEKLAREASLEVIWAPNEVTFSNLGEQPVLIGGGPEDHVFVRGFPPSYAGITFSQGRVEYAEAASGREATLTNGSRLEIGKLTLIVHTDVKG